MSGGTGFVNQGPDARPGGWVGRVLAWMQRASAYKIGAEPHAAVLRWCGCEIMLAVNRRIWTPYVSVFIKYAPDPVYASLRIGWRYDKYWGDANVVGYNPEPQIVGGAFLDVIVKGRMRRIVHY